MQRKPHTGILLAAAVIAALASGAGCDKLRARDKLNKGVQAFKGGQFDLAVEDSGYVDLLCSKKILG